MACGNCGLNGHYAPTCPKKRKAALSSTKPTSYRCSACGKNGHNKASCNAKLVVKTGHAVTTTYCCSTCGKSGHNKTTCPKSIVQKTSSVTPTKKSVVRHISPDRLYVLSASQLRTIISYSDVTASGSKATMIAALVSSRVTYRDLYLPELRAMCLAEKLPTSGCKDDVIARLRGSKPAPVQAYRTQQKALGANVKRISGAMSRATYRTRLRAAGITIHSDQDVLHIIASENGGADYAENYLFVGSRAPNRAMGSRYDYFYAWLAGKSHAAEAVRVSRLHGNAKGVRYTGPSAAQLITRGNTLSREIRMWDKEKKK